jgi:competence protein ComEC
MKKTPLFWISLVLLTGILLAALLPLRVSVWRVGFFVTLPLLAMELILLWRRKMKRREFQPLFLLLVLLFAGGWRYASVAEHPFSPAQLAYYNEKGKLEISGVVCADPKCSENSIQLVVCIDQMLRPRDQALRGKAVIFLRSGDYAYGDRLQISGEPKTPPQNETFSYKNYLAQRDIHTIINFPFVRRTAQNQGGWLSAGLFEARQKAYHVIQRHLPQPQSALLAGILLGIETDIPADLEKAFQDTGTAHIVAISGFNMVILAGLFLKGFRRLFSIWWAWLLAILAVILYTILVGAAPAVVRAAVMSSLAMSAGMIGRGQSGGYTLALTVAVMCLFNPLLVGDAGFQLSVSATLGLVLYAERMLRWFRRVAGKKLPAGLVKRLSGVVGEYFLFTLAAQLMTLPVVLYHFRQLSLTTLIANPLVLPVQPLIMILGGLVLLLALIIPLAGYLLPLLVALPLTYTIRVVTWLAGAPAGVLPVGQMGIGGVVLMYALIFAFTMPGEKSRLKPALKPSLLLLVMAALAFLVWDAAAQRPDGKAHIWVMAGKNQGAALLRTPRGRLILIHPGAYGNTLSAGLDERIPKLAKKIDLVLIDGSQPGTYASLPLLNERYRLREVAWLGGQPSGVSGGKILLSLAENDVESVFLCPGQSLESGDGVRIELDHNGQLLWLTYGKFRIAWLGAGWIAGEDLRLDGAILIDPHGVWQAAAGIAPLALLDYNPASPDGAGVISLPHHGTIELISDGESLWIRGEKR